MLRDLALSLQTRCLDCRALAAAARDGFGTEEGEKLDYKNAAMRFLMKRPDREGRLSVCPTDSLHLHSGSRCCLLGPGKAYKPGKAAFIAKMRLVAVIR